MINSKEKGKRFERKIASIFREEGYEARRSAQYCGNTGEAADVVGIPNIHIECKNQNRMCLYDWVDQAVRDSTAAGDGKLPVVIHKADNKEILVTMRLDDWFQLFREWEAGNEQ